MHAELSALKVALRQCIGLSAGRDAEVEFLASPRYPDDITLVIGESVAEIIFDPSTVEALRDKADEAVCRSREMRPSAGDSQSDTSLGASQG